MKHIKKVVTTLQNTDYQPEVSANLDVDECENETVTRLKDDIQQATNTQKTQLIPDGLLLINVTRKKISKESEFAIVEVKYCSDTQPHEQEDKAMIKQTDNTLNSAP
jgi:hypothetical protein